MEGRFVWFDYVTADVAAAVDFYTDLFGWTAANVDTGGVSYVELRNGERAIGGVVTMQPNTPSRSYWLSSLAVTDIQAGCDRVTALGGSVASMFAVGDVGRALVADPLGGVFALSSTRTEGDYVEQPGHWCWNELNTPDTDASLAFYTSLGGFTVEKMEMKEGPYFVLHRDGKPRGGMSTPPTPGPQAWMPYVQVESVDATVETAKELGANVHVAGEDVPGIGRIAIFSDPQGGMLGLLQPPTSAAS